MVVVAGCVELEVDLVLDFVLVVGVLVFLVVLELDVVLTFLAINVVLARASIVVALVVSPPIFAYPPHAPYPMAQAWCSAIGIANVKTKEFTESSNVESSILSKTRSKASETLRSFLGQTT